MMFWESYPPPPPPKKAYFRIKGIFVCGRLQIAVGAKTLKGLSTSKPRNSAACSSFIAKKKKKKNGPGKPTSCYFFVLVWINTDFLVGNFKVHSESKTASKGKIFVPIKC